MKASKWILSTILIAFAASGSVFAGGKKEQGVKAGGGGDFDLTLHRWGPDYRDPLTYLDLWLSDQHPVYRNKDYDAIVVSAGRGELARDLPKRFIELRRAEQILLRDIATIPLFQSGTSSLKKANVTGVEYHGVQGGSTYIWAAKNTAGIAAGR